MTSMIRTFEYSDEPGTLMYVLGLNTLYVNAVEADTNHDPRIVFLKALGMLHHCAAFVGGPALNDIGPTNAAELFATATAGRKPALLDVGLYVGTFYDLIQYPARQTEYYVSIDRYFWDATSKDGMTDIRYVIQSDSLAIGISDREVGPNELPAFENEAQWITSLTKLFRLIVMTGGDGYTFKAYASDVSYFTLLSEPIVAAEHAIVSTDWYRNNMDFLVWNDQNECFQAPAIGEMAK